MTTIDVWECLCYGLLLASPEHLCFDTYEGVLIDPQQAHDLGHDQMFW